MTNQITKGDKVRVTRLNGSTRRFIVLDIRPAPNASMGVELLLTSIGWVNASWADKA